MIGACSDRIIGIIMSCRFYAGLVKGQHMALFVFRSEFVAAAAMHDFVCGDPSRIACQIKKCGVLAGVGSMRNTHVGK